MTWPDLNSFMPHGHCYLWRPEVLWLNVGSDFLIGAAYFSIPLGLRVFMKKREDLEFKWMFGLFAAFIFACGTTHFTEILTTWHPYYFSEGLVKALTALVSVTTAILIWPLIPHAIKLPSPSQLREKNEELENLNQTLEDRVTEKTQAVRRLAQIVETAGDAVIATDLEGTIVEWNRSAETLFGYPRAEALGQHGSMLFPNDQKLELSKLIERLQNFESVEPYEAERIRSDGRRIPVEVSLSGIQDVSGELTGAAAVIRDISERVRFRHELERKNQEMEQFVYTVSHDLKSPLVTSVSFLRFLREDLEAGRTDEVWEAVSRLESSNTRMQGLIDDLLQLSRVGRIDLEPEDLDPTEVIRELQQTYEDQLEKTGLKIEVRDPLPRVWADPKRLYQVYENLLTNALKYVPEATDEPVVRFFGESDETHTKLCVEDNGPGVSHEYHAKIFRLFERLRSDKEGTGIGLAIVARIMQLHQGRVWVESQLGEGARFWIEFPHQGSPGQEGSTT